MLHSRAAAGVVCSAFVVPDNGCRYAVAMHLAVESQIQIPSNTPTPKHR